MATVKITCTMLNHEMCSNFSLAVKKLYTNSGNWLKNVKRASILIISKIFESAVIKYELIIIKATVPKPSNIFKESKESKYSSFFLSFANSLVAIGEIPKLTGNRRI